MQVFDEPGLLPTTKNICFAGPRPANLPDHGRRDSAALICYYTGAGTGTKYTIDYAAKKRLQIANIAQPPNGEWGFL